MNLIKGIHIKLIVYFVFIVVIPILVLYYFMYSNFQKFSMDKIIASSIYDTKLIGYSLDQLLKKVEDTSMRIFSDTQLSHLLTQYSIEKFR